MAGESPASHSPKANPRQEQVVPPPRSMLSIAACRASRTDGTACGAPPGERGLCFWHDPARRQEMVEAARLGGSRKTLALPAEQPLEARAARGVLASVLRALLEGAVDPGTARAAAYILQVERKIAEGAEMERRLAALEELVPATRRGRWRR